MANFDRIGSTGLRRQGRRGRADEEFHLHLRGPRGVRVYREITDNDSTTGAAFSIIRAMIQQVPWKAQEGNASDAAKGEGEFLFQTMHDMDIPWKLLLGEILSMNPYGWALFNLIFKYRLGRKDDPFESSQYDDGRVSIGALDIRSQESLYDWEWDEQGRVISMFQYAYPQSSIVRIPMEAAVLFRTEHARGNPEGRSMLRNVYRSWFLLKRLQELEAIGIERDLVGLPVMRLPWAYLDANAPEDKRNAYGNFKTLLQQIRRNEHEGVIFPASKDAKGNETGFDLELLSTGGSRQIDMDTAIKRYERAIAMNFGTNFQFLGMDKVGSFSLSSDMTNMFGLAIGAILDNIQDTFDRYVVQPLFELNGTLPEDRPKWVHGDVEKQDVAKFADMLLKLTDAQVLTPDDELEDFVRDEMQLPLRADDAVPRGRQAVPPPASGDMPGAPGMPGMPGAQEVDAVPDDAVDVTTGKQARFVPTSAMAVAAEDGLQARQRAAPHKRGMTPVTVGRARAISRREPLRLGDVQRMRAFFTAAAHVKRPMGSPAWQEWMGWGGDAGAAWCREVVDGVKRLEERTQVMAAAIGLDHVIKAGRGLMVGLFLSPETAKRMAIPGYEKARDLHVTLAYLGDSDAVSADARKRLDAVAQAIAATHQPLTGRISGIGMFTGQSDGDVVYASPDVPGLADLRVHLVEMLLSADVPVRMEHGFDPHVTLAYVAPGAPRPQPVVTNEPLVFDELVVADGPRRRRYQLGGG